MKVALSIAGSDSGGGAGIQADIKTFSALGVYGCTAITALTAQDTRRVSGIYPVPPEIVRDQIRSALRDYSPAAIKIGMVYNSETIDAVTRELASTSTPIVLDPILAAGTGARLLRDDAIDDFMSKLLPDCQLVTPNRMEAEVLSGTTIRTDSDAVAAAKIIKRRGAPNVIVKGGHFGAKQVVDVLVDRKGRVIRFPHSRVAVAESHGSGCNFSAAATAFLARGMPLEEACRKANEYVYHALLNSVKVGKGLPVTNPLSSIYLDAMRYRVIEELQQAVEELCSLPRFHLLIPETQSNFVHALPEATELSHVAGVRGRIVRIGATAVPASYIEFGASKHMASAVLAFMKLQPAFRAAVNIRYDEKLLKSCRKLLKVASYDRKKEPARTRRKEGSTMAWGISAALSAHPDAEVIYHTGDIGKEPMINVFGTSPAHVVVKITRILKGYQ